MYIIRATGTREVQMARGVRWFPDRGGNNTREGTPLWGVPFLVGVFGGVGLIENRRTAV